MNIPHGDGSLTLDNASVQRLMDYGVLHYTDEGWYVGKWPETNTPSALATEAGTAETTKIGSVHEGAGPKDNAQ